jgi:LacI family transcriptional regulator
LTTAPKKPAKLAPPRKRTSLKDLATYLNLSKTTISLILNDTPLAKNFTKDTRRRVREAAEKFSYRPSYFALNLNKGGSESIGVIVPEHSEGYFSVVMGGAERYLMEKNFMYFTVCHYWKPKLMLEYPELLKKRGAEGLLLLNTNADFDSTLPVVAISAHLEKEGVTNVILDHTKAARLAIKHLYVGGHRKIAFMKGDRHIMDTEPRWEALMAIAEQFGVRPTPERTVQVESNTWSPQIGYEATKRLLGATRNFTALVCFNDTAALGAIRALHEVGMLVPRDVSVLGFDDIVGAEFSVPSLTTIRQPLDAMGRKAVQILLDRIAHPQTKYPPNVLMQPKLVVRESTRKLQDVSRPRRSTPVIGSN